METTDERLVFTVTDLKQYAYCPRVVFYTYCLPLIRPRTFKMEAGAAAHERAKNPAKRRTLAAYGLKSGKRHFDMPVESEELGLRGKVDLVIEVDEGRHEWIPVEYKQTRRRTGPHIKQQVAAYGMMLEEMYGEGVRRGFVYSLVTRKAEEVRITARLREAVRGTVEAMREMVMREAMPEPPRWRSQCVNCEFRRFCNDVL